MRLALAFVVLAAVACKVPTLAGTNIPATDQNKEVLGVFRQYHDALEARDPTALIALTSSDYYDRGDASRGIGPTDYTGLQKKLTGDFQKINGLRLEATIKDIQVEGDKAHLDYFEVLRYAIVTPNGEVWKSESDDARMRFVKVSGAWKIASGM
jgi:hypothetical protein